MNRVRAFIAVDVSNKNGIENLQQELLQSIKWSPREVKPVEKQNFHFTLIFLGTVDLDTIDKIKAKLLELQFKPIKVTYSCLGGFPRSDFARVIWIGVDEEGGKDLVSLAELVISKMAEIGFKSKPFTPHLTIFRIKSKNLRLNTIISKYNHKTFGSDVISKIHLKKSDLTPAGPVYHDIFTVYAK
ncbi:MAG TPA: RNA 2',3'-cyclic phosphodiesterase [Nitrososphaeraceae archaeon]|nr:RNA 2',3'-cyclic phosphodiesterase [Nitrososphaeraceae archaeon]